jgi:hypothetical protein
MMQGEKIADRVASELRGIPEWRNRVRHQPGDALIRIEDEGDLDGAMLELRPAVDLDEVPVWVELEHGRADLSEIEFEAVSVSIVRWGKEHGERGLIANFPQMLLGPALAGRRHRNPVAGGRRADGSLELWIEATATGVVAATVDADPRLGEIAELRWRSAREEERLLLALVPTPSGRNLGLARLPFTPSEPLVTLELLVHDSLDAVAVDANLLESSAAAAYSEPGRSRWRELMRDAASGGITSLQSPER